MAIGAGVLAGIITCCPAARERGFAVENGAEEIAVPAGVCAGLVGCGTAELDGAVWLRCVSTSLNTDNEAVIGTANDRERARGMAYSDQLELRVGVAVVCSGIVTRGSARDVCLTRGSLGT